MADISYLSNQLLTTNVYVNPDELNNDIDTIINTKIIDKYENKCINEGYIIKGSINIKNKSLGKLKTINSESKIIYNVNYEASLLYPNSGDTIECYIDNYNKMGIVAYIKISDIYEDYKGNDTINESPFIIIIPNDKLKGTNYQVDDKINIVVLATRIKYNSTNIQIVGEIV